LVEYDYMVSFMKTKCMKTVKTRTQKKAGRTKRKLKRAALDVFTNKGVDAATVEEITEKADLGKGTLYQHFDDKEQIVITLVEEAIEHLIERIRSYDDTPETLEEMLEHLLDVHYEFSVESKEEFLLLFQGKLLLKLESEATEELEQPYIRYLEEIETQVAMYLSPRIAPHKIRRLACAVAGFVFGFFSFAMIGMDSDEIQTSIKPLRRVFVRSLSAFLGR
jgi:AcrR family transcriptional regulator